MIWRDFVYKATCGIAFIITRKLSGVIIPGIVSVELSECQANGATEIDEKSPR